MWECERYNCANNHVVFSSAIVKTNYPQIQTYLMKYSYFFYLYSIASWGVRVWFETCIFSSCLNSISSHPEFSTSFRFCFITYYDVLSHCSIKSYVFLIYMYKNERDAPALLKSVFILTFCRLHGFYQHMFLMCRYVLVETSHCTLHLVYIQWR